MGFRVETVMLSPETAQYAGGDAAHTGVAAIAQAAQRAEELGFDSLTTPEAGHDPFLPLAIAAEHTARIRLGTNVAIAFPRSPLVVAQAAWDLQALSNGRFQLGLGTQVKGHNERRYSTPWTGPPGPRLREYLLCLRAIFASFQKGSLEPFEGRTYRFTLMPPFFNPGPIEHPHVPIAIAAVNPYMARLAGELCDGLRLHPIATFRYTREVVIPALEAGAARAGRSAREVERVGAPFLAVGPDPEAVERAKEAVRQRIAFYASTRTYHAVLRFHGWEAVGQELHRLSVEGKWRELPRCIDDAMLAEFAIVATYDELAEKLRERCSGLMDTLLLDLPGELLAERDRVSELVAALQRD